VIRTSRVAFVLVAAALTAACSGATGLSRDLALARARWEERGPASYSITVSRLCECLEEWSGPVVVTVQNGVVESRHYTRNGAAVPSRYDHLFPSVPGLFELVERARREGAAQLDVSYDPTFGYPTRIAIDWHATHVDEEETYTASDFVPR
jgi:hypothetical protein